MSAFDKLIEDLLSGELGSTHIKIAYKAAAKRNPDIPEGIKDILAGRAGSRGLIGDIFALLNRLEGSLELAYRRGYDAGIEDAAERLKGK